MSARVHPAAEQGFGVAAGAYEKGRPTYHPDAVAWLVERLGLGPGTTVVDVGAGTGKLARMLVPSGPTVVAVEPVASMREQLAAAVPGVEVLDGTAEDLPLPDGSVDAVVVGQAFHWFDGPAALRDMARVLAHEGGLGLVWNERDQIQPLQAAVTEIVEPYRRGTPSFLSGRWRIAFDDDPECPFGPLDEHRVAHEQMVDADGLADRVGSTSFVAALPDGERSEVLARVRALVAGEPGPVPLRYTTLVYVARCRA